MITKLFRPLCHFSVDRVFYPALLSPDYDNVEFDSYYYRESAKLNVKNKNKHQILDTTLPKYLERQIEEDKRMFVKVKEILFVGRSNVGKSSLINEIFKDKKIARCAKQPGTTRFLHFHEIENKHAFIVDAPGYGFANMNKRRRHLWFGLTEEYMKVSTRLSQVFLMINFEHGLKDIDKQFMQRIDRYNVNVQIILTKVDKVKVEKYFDKFRAINEEIRRLNLKNINDLVIGCSSKNKFGMGHVRSRLLQLVEQSQPRTTDEKQDLLLSYVKELRVAPVDMQEKQKQLSKEYIVRKLIYNSKLTKYLV